MTVTSWGRTITSLSEQSDLRRELTVKLGEQGHQPSLVSDAVLVVSELTTNAFDHGNARQVWVTTETDQNRLIIAVGYPHSGADVHGIPPAGDMPGPHALGGRGLAIVEALTTSLTSTTDRDHFQTTVVLDGETR